MPEQNPAALVGRRFVTDFTVVSVEMMDGEVTATLLMHGEKYFISVEELELVINRGFVAELPATLKLKTGG